MTKTTVSLELPSRAIKALGEALALPKNDIVRDSVIQRFEFSFELSWKTLKRYFQWNQNLDESNIRNILREAAKQGLITSAEDWFSYHDARNMSSHTYDAVKADEVYEVAKRFHPDAVQLMKKLELLVK